MINFYKFENEFSRYTARTTVSINFSAYRDRKKQTNDTQLIYRASIEVNSRKRRIVRNYASTRALYDIILITIYDQLILEKD